MSVPAKTVTEEYTFYFSQNSATQLSIGSNASVSNLMFNVFDKDLKDIGYIMFDASFRSNGTTDLNNAQGGIFLNNNTDLIFLSNIVLTGSSTLGSDGSYTVNAVYATGKYAGKNVSVTVTLTQTDKRLLTIKY
jgi:hypothetical protein